MKRVRHIPVTLFLAAALTALPPLVQAELYELGRGVDIKEADFVLGELGDRLIGTDQLSNGLSFSPLAPRANARALAERLNKGLINPDFPIDAGLSYSPESTIIEVDALLAYPLCIVGADDDSIRWIEKNKQALLDNNAVCAVAKAKDKAQLERLQQAAAPISVLALPLKEITELHHIRQYPVLIMGTKLPGAQ